MAYRKPLFDHQQTTSVKNRTKFFEQEKIVKKDLLPATKSPLKATAENNSNNKTFEKLHFGDSKSNYESYYGTLDSAYETGSSAYNTVDSTFSSKSKKHFLFENTPTKSSDDLNKQSPSATIKSPSEMSYVPSYIKPVEPVFSPNVPRKPKVPARNFTLSNDNITVRSLKSRETLKNDKQNLREKYAKKQQEQLSGRKSLKERLQSLENGADVKLKQVSVASKRRLDIQMLQIKRPIIPTHPESLEDEDKQQTKYENDLTNQRIRTAEDQSSSAKDLNKPNCDESKLNICKPEAQVEAMGKKVADDTIFDDMNSCKVKPAAIKWKAVKKASPTPKNNPEIASSAKQDVLKTPCSSNTSQEEVIKKDEKLLQWRKLSPENLTSLQSRLAASNTEEKSFDCAEDSLTNSDEINVSNESNQNKELNTVALRNRPCAKSNMPPSLTIDVHTSDEIIVPVELRSPRSTKPDVNDEIGRVNMREKRNARVFHLPFPSEELSEANQSCLEDTKKKYLSEENLNEKNHTAPVKFFPTVLYRNYSNRKNLESKSNSSSTTSLTTVTSNLPTSIRSTSPTFSVTPKINKRNLDKMQQSIASSPKIGANRKTKNKCQLLESENQQKSERLKCDENSTNKSHDNIPPTKSCTEEATSRHIEHCDMSQDLDEQMLNYHDNQQESTLPSPQDLQLTNYSGNTKRAPLADDEIPFIDETCVEASNRQKCTDDPEDTQPCPSGPQLHTKTEPKPEVKLLAVKMPMSRGSSIKRSASAESVLSTNDRPLTTDPVRRRTTRSCSADRNKSVLRHSYMMATGITTSPLPDTTPINRTRSRSSGRRFSLKKKKESSSSEVIANVRKPIGSSSTESSKASGVKKEGLLSFKVATIDRGKRTSAQKCWKQVWVIIHNHLIFLCKEVKQDASTSNGSPCEERSSKTRRSGVHGSNPAEDERPLNLIGSLVSIAYNYVKRRNVFRLTTGNGSEYLFQADDNNDMLSWINAIQSESAHDGQVTINKALILRKSSQFDSGHLSPPMSPPDTTDSYSYQSPKPEKRTAPKKRSPKLPRHSIATTKDVDGSKRFKWRGSVNKIAKKFVQGNARVGGTFGAHLEDCPTTRENHLIPFVVELCCRLVEAKWIRYTGIYRVPGNNGTLNSLQDELNQKGPDEIDVETDERFHDVNVVSSLLKLYFRILPDPLFTNELYTDFIITNRKPNSEERLNGLRRLVHMLPGPHYETLKFLITHLKKVADHSSDNRMDVRNLAIVFGPTLVRSTASDNVESMVTDMSDQCRIVESILQNADWYFAKDEESVEAPFPTPVDTTQEQIVPSIDHLLVNVGRTADNSDNTSESSKSKHSGVSEKESFSRDVISSLFGKKWKLTGWNRREGKETEAQSSDDEFGFKEMEKNRSKHVPEKTKSEDNVALISSGVEEDTNAPKSARELRRFVSQSEEEPRKVPTPSIAPSDHSSHVYNFSHEQLSTSSSEVTSSPRVTPADQLLQRGDLLRASMSAATRRKHQPPKIPNIPITYHYSNVYKYGDAPQNRRFTRDPHYERNLLPFVIVPNSSTPISTPITIHPLPSPPQDNIPDVARTDPNIRFNGDTFEEKLKNLTNLDNDVTYHHPIADDVEIAIPFVTVHRQQAPRQRLKLSGPSMKAGAVLRHQDDVIGRKTSIDLFHERKIRRQMQRDRKKMSRASRFAGSHLITRCASEENVFQSASETAPNPSSHPSSRIRRRHTLGSGDSLPDKSQQKPHQAPKQLISNPPHFYPCPKPQSGATAMERLCPRGQVSIRPIHQPRVDQFTRHLNSVRKSSRRTESYL